MGKLVLGMLVGLVAGWGAAHLAGTEEAAPRAPEATSARAAAADATPAAPPPALREAEAPVPLAVLAGGSAHEIRRRFLGDEAARPEAGWPEVVRDRLASARAERDWTLFRTLLEAAARIGTDDAHAVLLDVLRDETLEFPRRMGRFFDAALKDAELPGIAAAARRRIERNVENGETSWVGVDGWAEMVARHGDRADCEWLLARSESGQFTSRAWEALSASRRPAALEIVIPRLLAGIGAPGHTGEAFGEECLQKFARSNPDRALALIEEFAFDPVRAASISPGTAGVLGELAARVDDDRVRRILASPRDTPEQLALCYAVSVMDRRGLDVSGLASLTEAPIALLERVASGAATDQERNLAGAARYAIEYNRPLWSERAAAALEGAGFAREAAKVRGGLSSDWNVD